MSHRMPSPLLSSPAVRGRRTRQSGVSLVEVLVASLVLALGLLGMAGMQARAAKSNQSAQSRTQAVMLSYYMLDAMRADKVQANAGGYNMTRTCDSTPSASGLALNTLTDWLSDIHTALGDPNACGAVNCESNVCTISIDWDDSRAGGLAGQTFTTSARL